MIFLGSVPALPGPCLRDAGRAFPLCPGLPPANASWGSRRREWQWSTEPGADRRPHQHWLGGLGWPSTRVLLLAAYLYGILPSPSENISRHPRTQRCFKPYTVGLDKLPELTHSDSSPLCRERSPHCWPTCLRWGFIFLMWKAALCTKKAAHPMPPISFLQ